MFSSWTSWHFSDFGPFLELAFGVNLLFGAWDGLYRHAAISESKREFHRVRLIIAEVGESKISSIEDILGRYDKCVKQITNLGRITGVLFAFLIGMAFFFIHPDTRVDSSFQVFAVAFAGGWQPFLMLWLLGFSIIYDKYRIKGTIDKAVLDQNMKSAEVRRRADEIRANAQKEHTEAADLQAEIARAVQRYIEGKR